MIHLKADNQVIEMALLSLNIGLDECCLFDQAEIYCTHLFYGVGNQLSGAGTESRDSTLWLRESGWCSVPALS